MITMLWRFLFSVVAISCTLSRIHARGQRLDRIKDLMCVLFLSGMQKEDLDVSMLSKLQRYNVNIEEISNGELEKICNPQGLTSTNAGQKVTENKDNISNPYSDLLMQADNTRPEELIKEVFRDQYFKENEKIHEPNLNFRPNPSTERNNAHFIEYNKGQPNIDSVMNFWKNLSPPAGLKAQDNAVEKTKVNRLTEEGDTNIKSKRDPQKSEFINRILNHIILNDKETADIKDLSPPNKYQEEIYSKNNKNKMMKNLEKFHAIDSIHYPINGENIMNDPIILVKSEQGNIPKIISPMHNIQQHPMPHFTREKSPNLGGVHTQKFSPYMPAPFQFPPINFPFHNDMLKAHSNQNSNQFVNEDFVKKIAQSVKDMVMLELRKEFKTTTTTTTTTTSTITSSTSSSSSPTTTPTTDDFPVTQKEIRVSNDSVMERFLEMIESLSKQSQAVNLLAGNKGSTDKNNDRVVEKKSPTNEMDLMIFTPLPYNIPPQVHKVRLDVTSSHMENKPHPWPKTFQTNSLEIPPLGIPIPQQLNPINQNIIVTTSYPFKQIHYESDSGLYSDGSQLKLYPKEIFQSPLSAKFSKRSDECPLHHECNHKNEDIIRFRLSNKGNAKYDTDYYEKINVGNLESNSPLNKDEDGRIILPKFHEKLEKTDIDAYSDMAPDDCCNSKFGMTKEMLICCNKKIASRQQMSIANLKRGKKDDTHFQNFLKSQQKVTDMLEKILGTKGKTNGPHSVETL